mmetsp:Transcript_6438/g.15553  ORF Transcript_6438/g.15553 Transcript_6438/m.15553 type:complete len:128 (-) Transcript_6438:609-992(-)
MCDECAHAVWRITSVARPLSFSHHLSLSLSLFHSLALIAHAHTHEKCPVHRSSSQQAPPRLAACLMDNRNTLASYTHPFTSLGHTDASHRLSRVTRCLLLCPTPSAIRCYPPPLLPAHRPTGTLTHT